MPSPTGWPLLLPPPLPLLLLLLLPLLEARLELPESDPRSPSKSNSWQFKQGIRGCWPWRSASSTCSKTDKFGRLRLGQAGKDIQLSIRLAHKAAATSGAREGRPKSASATGLR
mmetsp:Transcript_119965/g.350631  ORF Transcript_119965/g.350631 Transcript_119965/m.350631 type:complete len:114 (+) Transcript_119965:208-549(+)